MKKLLFFAVFLSAALSLPGCLLVDRDNNCDLPTCEVNNTGELQVVNSTTADIDFLLNDAYLFTVNWLDDNARNIPAGTHSYQVRRSDSQQLLQEGQIIVFECETTAFEFQ